MENRKLIVSLYIAAGIIVWYLSHSSIQYLHTTFYKFSRIPGIQIGKEAIPVLLGGITAVVLFRHPVVNTVLEEVVAELKKVTWPNRDDVVKSTYVVMICILIASVFLATFDLIWGKVIGYLLS